jgi:hypothetical protein
MGESEAMLLPSWAVGDVAGRRVTGCPASRRGESHEEGVGDRPRVSASSWCSLLSYEEGEGNEGARFLEIGRAPRWTWRDTFVELGLQRTRRSALLVGGPRREAGCSTGRCSGCMTPKGPGTGLAVGRSGQ